MRNFTGVAAFFPAGETQSVIDVTFPHRNDISETLETAIWIKSGAMRYRIPALEAALANKYGAALTLTRDSGKRAQDMVDFYTMVSLSVSESRTPINRDRLAELGELVWPGGGGEKILHLVEECKAGRVPNLID